MKVFIVKCSGMQDIIFEHEFDADNFIQDEVDGNEGPLSSYKKVESEMSREDYLNLEEWDG